MLEKWFLDGNHTPFSADNEAGKENSATVFEVEEENTQHGVTADYVA